MKIIRTSRLIISISLMIVLTAALVLVAMEIKQGSPPEIKLYRENILFWGIIGLSLQIWLGLSLLLNHRGLINEVRRLARIGDFSQPQARKILEHLGPLGREMERMMREQNNLVHLRSNRIPALNNLVKLMGSNYSEPIIISDVNGDILSVSGNLSEKLKKNNPDISGVTCTPVTDMVGEIHFCLWEMETSRFTGQSLLAPVKSRGRRTGENIRGLISRMRKPKAKASPGSHESGQSDASGKP
ncbi:MAG: hypothetical protein JXR86_01230 [Spirochaetales bacterium]|nr:hypothetical protein [Spirochaetales bacterium]